MTDKVVNLDDFRRPAVIIRSFVDVDAIDVRDALNTLISTLELADERIKKGNRNDALLLVHCALATARAALEIHAGEVPNKAS